MEYKQEAVFNLDGNTQLEFLNTKTIIVIDKERFAICKQLEIENALDQDYANFLNIPEEKVRYFKYKMQIFEESIRSRRRAAKLEKRRKKAAKAPTRKREISSEERFRRARDLISRNMSTNQISKILKVSERSVTRFKRRMREEKRRLKAEGKLPANDPNDTDDEDSFRHLKPEDKMKKAKELFRKRLKIHEISEILKISERSVRRWKDKLSKAKDKESEECLADVCKVEVDDADELGTKQTTMKRPIRAAKVKIERLVEEEEEDEEEEEAQNEETLPPRKKRRLYVDREKAQYAKELIDNKLSNKEMSMLLEMSIACVRKLKMKILNGTVDEMIDNSEEHYAKLEKAKGTNEKIDPDCDPLHVIEYLHEPVASTSSFGYERKPKVVLRDREMYMVRLLREHNIRTMDIAKMMKISERSVTRLLAKSREMEIIEYEADVVTDVEKLLADKDEILNEEMPSTPGESIGHQSFEPVVVNTDESKRQLGLSLLAMNVKTKDVALMLDVCEKTVQRWKVKMAQQQSQLSGDDAEVEADGHSVFEGLLETKEEVADYEYADYDE